MKLDKQRVYRHPEFVTRWEVTWEWTDLLAVAAFLAVWLWARR
jgi:hypothetical protein